MMDEAILVGFTAGRAADALDDLSDEAITEAAMSAIAAMFPG